MHFQLVLHYARSPSELLFLEVRGEVKSKATSYTTLLPGLLITSTSGSSFGGFDLSLSIMRDVMEVIRDNKIRVIGICGMGGVCNKTCQIWGRPYLV